MKFSLDWLSDFVDTDAAGGAEGVRRLLDQAGFPIESDAQFLGLGTPVPGCDAQGSDKSCRRQLVGRGHRVLMLFGDQLGDSTWQPASPCEPSGLRF